MLNVALCALKMCFLFSIKIGVFTNFCFIFCPKLVHHFWEILLFDLQLFSSMQCGGYIALHVFLALINCVHGH